MFLSGTYGIYLNVMFLWFYSTEFDCVWKNPIFLLDMKLPKSFSRFCLSFPFVEMKICKNKMMICLTKTLCCVSLHLVSVCRTTSTTIHSSRVKLSAAATLLWLEGYNNALPKGGWEILTVQYDDDSRENSGFNMHNQMRFLCAMLALDPKAFRCQIVKLFLCERKFKSFFVILKK